jgi:transcriptional regulator with XRE-family HTH domain
MAISQTCVPGRVTKQTIMLRGVPVSLDLIAYQTGVSACMISRIFGGSRNGSVRVMQGIANALGMSVDETLQALEEYRQEKYTNLDILA